MFTLGRVHNGQHQPVNGDEHADCFGQVNHEVAGLEKIRERQDKNREMEKERRVGEVSDHLASHLGAVGVVISQKAESGIESPALLAGAQESNVKFWKPGP